MTTIKQIGKLVAEIDEKPTGELVITLTVPPKVQIDVTEFERLLREVIGAVHDVLIIWHVL